MKRLKSPLVLLVGLILLSLLGKPGFAAGPLVKTASKVPWIVRLRTEAVTRSLAANGGRRLSTAMVAALSDPFVQVDSTGRLLLLFHASRPVGRSEREQLTALGAVVVLSTAEPPAAGRHWPAGLSLFQAWVPADRVDRAAALPWVAAVTAAERNPPDAGAANSQGVQLHRADLAQAAGVDGAGIHIGVVSDGVSHLADAQASGDLPASVTVLDPGNGDEGTAMLEIIHDMAPGALLLFRASDPGVAAYITAMQEMAAAGAEVITEDLAFDTEPVFQQGMAAAAAQDLAAGGISIHSSAGNLGFQHAARVTAAGTGTGPDGSAGPFTGCTVDPLNVVDIDPAGGTAFDVSIPIGMTITVSLQWSEPRAIFPTAGAGGFTNLDLYLMNAAGTECLTESLGIQGGGAGDTLEQLSYSNATGAILKAKIVVNRAGASGAVADPLIDLRWRKAIADDAFTREGSLNPDSNYTAGATSAAAANAAAGTDPATVALEAFSAAGPIQLLSTTVCPGGSYPCPAGGVAGATSFNGGGPTWTGADRVAVSGAGGFSPAFNGTSAAAPHAAACDALVRQELQNEGTLPTVALVSSRLRGTAIPRGGPEWGAGVLNCQATRRLLVLLDRTGSMGAIRANGNSRCSDALKLAKEDVHNFFLLHPAAQGTSVAVWTFADSAPTELTNGFVDEAAALAALDTLAPEGCDGSTPLADAICSASDALNAALPGSAADQRVLAISSDGDENNSHGPCSGPPSAGGPPYDPGSWQQKVEAKLLGQNVALTRFWSAVTRPAFDSETHQRIAGLGVPDKAFFEQLAHVTGGTFQFVSDGGRLPPPFGGFVGVQTIPALDGWGLSLLAAALLASAVALLRRRRSAGPNA